MIEKIKIKNDQNIVDLAIQEYGSIEGLVKLARGNNLNVDGDTSNITPLLVETAEVVVPSTRTFYKNLNYIVATGQIPDEQGTFDESFDESFF
jgi:hypothetical protein